MIGGYILDWLNLIFRWAHLIAGISWIGASFYFVWLDDSLRLDVPERDRERGIQGELWSVHGGGFYHNQKFLTGPRGEPLSADLHWFYWEAYSTWITGMATQISVQRPAMITFLRPLSRTSFTTRSSCQVLIIVRSIGACSGKTS